MAATTADFTTFDDTDQPLNAQWVVMARCLQSLGPFFESKLATGTEPADILHGLYLGIDAQAVTRKDWRFKVSSTNTFDVDENTGTDASPVWVTRLTLPSGVSSTVTTDGQGIEIVAGVLSLELDSTTLSRSASGVKVATGGITNTEVSASAALAYSKLALTGNIVNADISASAAIAYSKLALTASIVNADVGNAAAIAYSKLALTASVVNADISASAAIAYSKLALTGTIVNADVNASAAIAYSKLALTGSILNADINASAAIAYSKLALTGNIVNADINASAAIAYSKLSLAASIVNADIANAAAIAYSKLALTGNIVNADVSASAAIAYSKLNLATSIVNADVGNAAAIAYSKLNLATSILNADINASAAIAHSKIAALTASRALVSDGSGIVSVATTTATEIGYVNGVTSAIQTQLNTLSGGSGAFLLLHTYTPSNAASVDITSQISSSYDNYLIIFDITPATDNTEIWARTDTNNGASFDASSYLYKAVIQSGTTTLTGQGITSPANQIVLTTTGVANDNNSTGYLLITSRGSGSGQPHMLFGISYADDSSSAGTGDNPVFRWGSATRIVNAAIDAVQILMSSGNISGTVRIYGIKNS